jgi:hypothetical protein
MNFSSEDLAAFPTVEDFAVTLADSEEGGKHIEYRSPSRGRLAGFPVWDHADRDLRHFILTDIPLGTRAEPYFDRDDGWRIVIFEEGDWVYVAEGSDADATEFESQFRVSGERYLKAWSALIDFYNPATPLDETEPE